MKIKDKILSETSEEVKQRIRDTANKLVMKQETLKEDFAIGFCVWLADEQTLDITYKKEHFEELLEIYKKTL